MVTGKTGASVAKGILPRILRSWVAPGRVVTGLARQGVSEAGLIAILIGALSIFLLAQLPGHARAATIRPDIPFEARLGGALLAVMFLMPLLAYAFAGLVAFAMRLLGRPISGQSSRLALFWALLAVSPAMLLAGLVTGLVGPSAGLTAVNALAGIGFLAIWLAGLRALSGPGGVAA